ncbi:hypothetical protein BG011_008633 [Mortierella polycephala]|uniref:Inhibitor I9 domain-containing protein n=1 Tax=Mortierella polycephala TaxID=41804 RepID=A0A9P6PPL5_9FUNG|nr:hypothetical protein BG011_008633 [Mortierella polycephala]
MSSHQNEAANAFSASVLPVGTHSPGSATAHSLATAPGSAPSTVPSGNASSAGGTNKVIVVFKNGTSSEVIDSAIEDVKSKGGKIAHRYESALLGFSAEMPDNSVQALNTDPSVDYVEPDGEVSIYTKNLLSNK